MAKMNGGMAAGVKSQGLGGRKRHPGAHKKKTSTHQVGVNVGGPSFPTNTSGGKKKRGRA